MPLTISVGTSVVVTPIPEIASSAILNIAVDGDDCSVGIGPPASVAPTTQIKGGMIGRLACVNANYLLSAVGNGNSILRISSPGDTAAGVVTQNAIKPLQASFTGRGTAAARNT